MNFEMAFVASEKDCRQHFGCLHVFVDRCLKMKGANKLVPTICWDILYMYIHVYLQDHNYLVIAYDQTKPISLKRFSWKIKLEIYDL